ncbi:MAG: sugar ABC transporter permease [Caldilineaceae bacterium]|nr:sugar ABC transporter permease [Caldilineaceae bacterium]
MARYAVSLQVGLTILAVLLLLLLQGILILLALSDAQLGGGAAAAVGVDNYWAMVRSFEFRRALANTLWVLAMALVIIVPALGVVMRLGEQSRRLRVLVLVAVIVPLAMPGALGALAWRSTLEVLHIPLDRRWVALPVFALVQAWRAFPLAVAVRTAPLRQHQRTRAGWRARWPPTGSWPTSA